MQNDRHLNFKKVAPQRKRHQITLQGAEGVPATSLFERNVPYSKQFQNPSAFGSCICCSQHFRMPLYTYWCNAIDEKPRFHRKQWEYVYICQVLYERNMLMNGRTGIGFGVGKEPLVALFASRGVKVLATDLAAPTADALGWTVARNEHCGGQIDALNERSLCEPSAFKKLVSFRTVDMNRIPGDLEKYDFCWSSCAFEHLGSIRHGMDFVLNSCKLLRPGGVAVHTTEFNLSSNNSTLDNHNYVLYRKCDIEKLVKELTLNGYYVEPVDYYAGHDPLDKHVDVPPYNSEFHLRLQLENFTSASVGIVIHKKF